MSLWKRSDRVYVVRVEPYRARTVHGSRADARKVEGELRRRRSMGEFYEAPPNLLDQELDGWLERAFATRKLSPRTREWYARNRNGWRPLGHVRVCDLTRTMVEDRTAARAAVAPKSAADELTVLKQALTEAKRRGQRVDDGIFAIKPVERRPREGRALSQQQLETLASWLPDHLSRLPLLAGFVGARLNVWLTMEDGWLDLEAGVLRVPAAVQKTRRAQQVALTPPEVTLFREQLLARPAGSTRVFPTKTGKPFSHRAHFYNRAWWPAVTAAAREDGLPFGRLEDGKLLDGLRFHDLRHTAISLMASAGMRPELIAHRVGHSDGGALIFKRYRHLFGHEMDAALRLLAVAQQEPDEAKEAQA